MYHDKWIVITSINKPTAACEAFSKWDGWQLLVVGDTKTPAEWNCGNAIFLSVEQQDNLFGELSSLIPYGTYKRKSLGYLYAINHGAEVIFETDDDNLPYAGAQEVVESCIAGNLERIGVSSSNGWVNIHRLFGDSDGWPRGFPLSAIAETGIEQLTEPNNEIGVVQFLADIDPDVDAIYRLANGKSITFEKRAHMIGLNSGSYCPFNSQATLWTKDLFPLMFLPTTVTERTTDILRGYIAQACLWQLEKGLTFASPIVYQKRNAHDLMSDFISEFPIYTGVNCWREALNHVSGWTPSALYRSALNALCLSGFVGNREVVVYNEFANRIGKRYEK